MTAMVPVFMLGFVAFFLYVLFKFIHKKPTTENDIKTSVSAVNHEECHADDTKSEMQDKEIGAKDQETLEKRQVPDTLEEPPKEVQNDEDAVGQAVQKDVLPKVETSQSSGEIYGGEKESIEEKKISEDIFEACVEPTDKHEPEKELEKSNKVLSSDLKEEIVTQDISETSDLKESEGVIDSKEPFESSEQADNIHQTESLLSVPNLEATSQASSDKQFSVLVKPGKVSATKETSEYLMEISESSKNLFDENVEVKVESDIVSTTELLSSEEMFEVNSKPFSEEPGKLSTTEEPKECSDAIEITNGALRTQVEENITFTQACDKVPESSVTEKYPDTVEKVFKDELSSSMESNLIVDKNDVEIHLSEKANGEVNKMLTDEVHSVKESCQTMPPGGISELPEPEITSVEVSEIPVRKSDMSTERSHIIPDKFDLAQTAEEPTGIVVPEKLTLAQADKIVPCDDISGSVQTTESSVIKTTNEDIQTLTTVDTDEILVSGKPLDEGGQIPVSSGNVSDQVKISPSCDTERNVSFIEMSFKSQTRETPTGENETVTLSKDTSEEVDERLSHPERGEKKSSKTAGEVVESEVTQEIMEPQGSTRRSEGSSPDLESFVIVDSLPSTGSSGLAIPQKQMCSDDSKKSSTDDQVWALKLKTDEVGKKPSSSGEGDSGENMEENVLLEDNKKPEKDIVRQGEGEMDEVKADETSSSKELLPQKINLQEVQELTGLADKGEVITEPPKTEVVQTYEEKLSPPDKNSKEKQYGEHEVGQPETSVL